MGGPPPTKYRDHHPALLEKILGEGGFNVTFCAEVGICEDTFYKWVKRHPALAESLKVGTAAAKKIFVEKVRDAAFDTDTHKVNNGLIALLAVNIHGMVSSKAHDKKEIKQETTITMAGILGTNDQGGIPAPQNSLEKPDNPLIIDVAEPIKVDDNVPMDNQSPQDAQKEDKT